MLPDFPKIKRDRYNRLMHAAMAEARKKDEVLNELRLAVQHEGDKVELRDVDNNVAMTGYEHFSAKIIVDASELPTLDDERWSAKLAEFASSFADAQVKLLLRRVEEAARASGNVTTSRGPGPSAEGLLSMLEKIQLDFHDRGREPQVAVLVHPSQIAALQAIEATPEYEARYKAIIEHQHNEGRIREARRKLVD